MQEQEVEGTGLQANSDRDIKEAIIQLSVTGIVERQRLRYNSGPRSEQVQLNRTLASQPD